MKPIDRIIDRLDGVKGSDGKYRARCPAHDGRNLTLSIKEREDGKVNVTCFKGCTADEITAAVGLQTKDLYPDSNWTAQDRKRYARTKNIAKLEAALNHELLILLQVVQNRVTSRQLAEKTDFRMLRPEWQPYPDEHWKRELLAVKRIKNGLEALYGR